MIGGEEVDLLIHHRVGSEVRMSTIRRIRADEVPRTLDGISGQVARGGMVTLSASGSITGAIPARCIELIEVKRP